MTPRHAWERARSLHELQDLLIEEPGLFPDRRPSVDAPWRDAPLAFFDVETTGLKPESGDRILELAILRQEPGSEERRFNEIFDPGRPIPREAARIHSIRPSQVRSCRTFESAIPEVISLLAGAVWVGHNLAFDVRFLRWELKRCGRVLAPGWILDTLLLARRWCRLPRNTLPSVAAHLDVPGRNSHQALDDILMTREILPLLISRISPPPESLHELLSAMLPRAEVAS